MSILKIEAVPHFTHYLPVYLSFYLFFFPLLCIVIVVQNQIKYNNSQNDMLFYIHFLGLIIYILFQF